VETQRSRSCPSIPARRARTSRGRCGAALRYPRPWLVTPPARRDRRGLRRAVGSIGRRPQQVRGYAGSSGRRAAIRACARVPTYKADLCRDGRPPSAPAPDCPPPCKRRSRAAPARPRRLTAQPCPPRANSPSGPKNRPDGPKNRPEGPKKSPADVGKRKGFGALFRSSKRLPESRRGEAAR
jgi:hypothetical protein